MAAIYKPDRSRIGHSDAADSPGARRSDSTLRQSHANGQSRASLAAPAASRDRRYSPCRYKYGSGPSAIIFSSARTNRRSHAAEASQQGSEESRQQGEGRPHRRQEAQEAAKGKLRHLHLQGAEAGPPRHGHQQQGHVDHELVRERHLRAHRRRGVASGALQPAARRSRVARSRRPSACCFPASWPSTPSARAPRPSPSTRAPSRRSGATSPATAQIGSFQSHPLLEKGIESTSAVSLG